MGLERRYYILSEAKPKWTEMMPGCGIYRNSFAVAKCLNRQWHPNNIKVMLNADIYCIFFHSCITLVPHEMCTHTHVSTHILFWSFIYMSIHTALLDIWHSSIPAIYYSSDKYIDPGRTNNSCSCCSFSYSQFLFYSTVMFVLPYSDLQHFTVWRLCHYIIVGGGGEWKYNHYILFEQNTTTVPVLMDSSCSLLCSQKPTTWPDLQPAHIFEPYFSNIQSDITLPS